ncbi:hypothetical protein [Fructilactobacillus florum]|uniref:hypothetical protein n=1 Tax=Fructilactobacillus florum TaxID=640331 RepID=UPI0006D12EEF|nr:hypothetical protein [Fructilactobacillus florum]
MRTQYRSALTKYLDKDGNIDHDKVDEMTDRTANVINAGYWLNLSESELMEQTPDNLVDSIFKAQRLQKDAFEMQSNATYNGFAKALNQLFSDK